jgi:hypothetical protein
MAVEPSQLFKLEPVGISGEEVGQREIEFGKHAFTASGTTVEVRTALTEIEAVIATPADATFTGGNGRDLLYSDGVISSSQVTIGRAAAGKSGLSFWYTFIGTRYATS